MSVFGLMLKDLPDQSWLPGVRFGRLEPELLGLLANVWQTSI